MSNQTDDIGTVSQCRTACSGFCLCSVAKSHWKRRRVSSGGRWHDGTSSTPELIVSALRFDFQGLIVLKFVVEFLQLVLFTMSGNIPGMWGWNIDW